MIIKKIHIENFGKLSNVDLQFDKGLNEIFAENGWGKTTLSIFIKAMFYGMPPARENIKMERKKYMPWQGGVFGGYIEYKINDKNYRLTRSFGKTPESDTIEIVCTDTNKLVELPKNEIGEELFGVGKDSFEMTAYFPQLNFKSFSNDQISANVLGLDKLKFDLANVKDAIDKIKKKISEIKKQKIKTEAFILIKNKAEELEKEILILKKNMENLYQKIIQNKEELSKHSVLLSSSKEQLNFQEKMYKEKQILNDALQEKTEKLNELYSYGEKILNDKKQEKCKVNKKQILSLSIIPVALIAVIVMYIFNFFSLPILFTLIGVIIGLSLILFFSLRDGQNDGKINLQNENNDEILMLKKEISLLKKNLEIYSSYTNPDLTSYNQVRDELLAISLEGKNLEQEKLEKENLLEKFLDEFESLMVEIEEKKALNERMDYNINLLQKTYDYLEQAKENLSERFVAPVNEQMGMLREKINLRGRKFVVDTNFDIIEQTNFGNKDLAYSSEGYKDIMSFCMRVLLIREVYKAERPFIVLDDTFVNLDDENLKKAKEIVRELSREYQVIYICCNSRSSLR